MSQIETVSIEEVLRMLDGRIDLVASFWKNTGSDDPKKERFCGELVRLKNLRYAISSLPRHYSEGTKPKWASEIEEAYERAKANPYIRKPLSRAMYEVWHRYDQTEVERR